MSEKRSLVIIGSGPSGYTAALYAARAQLELTLFAGYQSGGQLMWTTDIENFPGFVQGVAGPQLMSDMRAQAERFGAQIRDEYVTAVDFSQRPFKIWNTLPDDVDPEAMTKASAEELQAITARVKKLEPAIEAQSVIISTGASSIMLNIPGEQKFFGHGVSTCAVCDAAFYKEKDTYVVGGGDSAMEDTLALTKFAKSVTVVHRREAFKASKIMQDRVLNNPKVKVLWNSAVTKVNGEDKVTGITISDLKNQTSWEVPTDGLFVAIGHTPMTTIFKDQVLLDEHGYVVTRQSHSHLGVEAAQAALDEKKLVAYPSMTSVEGVFAAGDVVDVRYKQAITAAAQGCSAALDAEKWLEALPTQ